MGRFYKPTNFTPEEVMFELPKEAAASAINYVDTNLTLNEQTAAELSNSFDTYYKNVLPYDQPYVKEYLNKYKPIIDEIAGKMSNSQDWRNHQGALLQLSRDFKNDITTGNLSKFLQEKAASDADQKKAQEMIKIGEGKGGTNDTFAKLLLGKSFKDHSATTSYDPKTGTWHSYKSNLLSTSDLQDEYFKYAEKFKADKTSNEWQTDSKDGMWRSTNKQTGEVVSENDIKRGFHEFISGNPQYANQISVGENVGYYSGLYEKDDKGEYKVDDKGNKIPIPITIQKEVVDSRTGKKHMVDVYNPEHISNKFSAISANAFGYSNTSSASSREETEANKSSLIAGREAAADARDLTKIKFKAELDAKADEIKHQNAIKLKQQKEGEGSATGSANTITFSAASASNVKLTNNTPTELLQQRNNIKSLENQLKGNLDDRTRKEIQDKLTKEKATYQTVSEAYVKTMYKIMGRTGLTAEDMIDNATSPEDKNYYFTQDGKDYVASSYSKDIFGNITPINPKQISLSEHNKGVRRQQVQKAHYDGFFKIDNESDFQKQIKQNDKSGTGGQATPVTNYNSIIENLKSEGAEGKEITLNSDGKVTDIKPVNINEIEGEPIKTAILRDKLQITTADGKVIEFTNPNLIAAYLGSSENSYDKTTSEKLYEEATNSQSNYIFDNVSPTQTTTVAITPKGIPNKLNYKFIPAGTSSSGEPLYNIELENEIINKYPADLKEMSLFVLDPLSNSNLKK